jgi:pyruvate,water dikinase
MKAMMNGASCYDSATGEWNDSLTGDFLWSNVNTSEAIPDVMTPSTWSLWQYYYIDTNPVKIPESYPFCGNIGGRAYLNLSLVISLYRSVGKDIRREMHADIIGPAKSVDDIPLIPFPPLAAIWMVLPGMLRARRFTRLNSHRLENFLVYNLDWCREGRERVWKLAGKPALLAYWQEELKPRFYELCWYLRSVTMQFSDPFTRLRLDLESLEGVDTLAIQTGLTDSANKLASITPLLGLSQVIRGEMSQNTYLDTYGHRGPHELELFAPGLEEDSLWLDRKLDEFRQNPVDVEALLAIQHACSQDAWQVLEKKYPDKTVYLRRLFERTATAARAREGVRSELTRLTRLVRQFLLRVGEDSGLENSVFFLSLEEMEAYLAGGSAPLESIPVRMGAYQRLSALPSYPAIIIGRFDPYAWAADPQRRSDLYDARASRSAPSEGILHGFAGAAGLVEGTVRRLDRPEDGEQLQPGDILVTVTTNIGWTSLFPRLAAIVTDVGAPLSHAAIVARELGIPAVVGCGNATMLLKTGDRVRVDGGKGTVELLERFLAA